jgi:hypothetical protein
MIFTTETHTQMSEVKTSVFQSLESAIDFVEKKIGELQSMVSESHGTKSLALTDKVGMQAVVPSVKTPCRPTVSAGASNKVACICARCTAAKEASLPNPIPIDRLGLSTKTVLLLQHKYKIHSTTNILETASVLFDDAANELAILEILQRVYHDSIVPLQNYTLILDDHGNNLLGDVLDLKMHHLANFLLDHPDLISPEILNHTNKIGDTSLIICIAGDMIDSFHKIMNYDYLNMEIPTYTGDTPLMFALIKKNREMAMQLFHRSSAKSLFAKNKKNRSAIHMAVFFGELELANLIFEKMFMNEEVREEAQAFLSSDSRNVLLRNCCNYQNAEIAIRLLNLPFTESSEQKAYPATISFCIKHKMRDVLELILMKEKNLPQMIRGEGRIEENNIIFALAEPSYEDLVWRMVPMIDLSNPHISFHFCHEMIVACSLQNPIFNWMVDNYRISTYNITDPDMNSIYLHMAVNQCTNHFKTLYGRESGEKPNFLLNGCRGKNTFFHAISTHNEELILFILENLDSEKIYQNRSQMDLMSQYQKMVVKNRPSKILLNAFEAKMREIRVFDKIRRDRENADLEKLLNDLGETSVSPKKAPKKKSLVIVPPPSPTPIKEEVKEEVANEVGVRQMVKFFNKKSADAMNSHPPKKVTPLQIPSPKVIEKKTIVPIVEKKPSPKPVEKKLAKKEIQRPIVVESPIVATPVQTVSYARAVAPLPEPFVWDCERTDAAYLTDLTRFVLEPLGIF